MKSQFEKTESKIFKWKLENVHAQIKSLYTKVQQKLSFFPSGVVGDVHQTTKKELLTETELVVMRFHYHVICLL